MGEQVGDVEYRIARLLADAHLDLFAVFPDDDTVQGQRDRRPLVLLDTAIVVRLEIADLLGLIQRVLLEVKARGVDMCRAEANAVGHGRRADGRQNDRLAAVVEVDLVAGFELHAGLERHIALLFQLGNEELHRLALGLAGVHEVHVIAAETLAVLFILGAHALCCVSALRKELLLQLGCCIFFLVHGRYRLS